LELCKLEFEAKKQHELKNIIQEKERLNELIKTSVVHYPELWYSQQEDLELFAIAQNTCEYNFVIERINRTYVACCVSQIYRIQNQKLYKRYYHCRQEIASNNNGFSNEQYLFHGSHSSNISKIMSEGLDTRVANMQGAIGAGIYFATRASTSMQYVNYVNNIAHMLLCRVALGTITKGARGLRRPPAKPDGELYDSVDGFLGTDPIYAIFDNRQSYPEYLICFVNNIINK